MELLTYRITGVSPILQNNPAKMATQGSDGLKSGKKIYVAADEAEAAVYRNEQGEIIVPAIAFRAALFRAATNRKIGKLSAKSAVAGSIFPVETEVQLVNAKTNKAIKDYKIHSCRAVVNKAGIIRVRPMIENWACDLVLEVDTEMIPNVAVITELLNIAGKIAGIMDWRPEKLGTFGRFTAKLA